MSIPRIIKKYSNRRLYDTVISKYITLDEVKELVTQKIPFKIVDNRTGEDMTNYVLLQIITEGESGAKPIFTTEILQNIIRFYNNPMQQAASDFFEKTFASFNDQQANPFFDTMTDLAKRNMELWQNLNPTKKPADKSKNKKR